ESEPGGLSRRTLYDARTRIEARSGRDRKHRTGRRVNLQNHTSAGTSRFRCGRRQGQDRFRGLVHSRWRGVLRRVATRLGAIPSGDLGRGSDAQNLTIRCYVAAVPIVTHHAVKTLVALPTTIADEIRPQKSFNSPEKAPQKEFEPAEVSDAPGDRRVIRRSVCLTPIFQVLPQHRAIEVAHLNGERTGPEQVSDRVEVAFDTFVAEVRELALGSAVDYRVGNGASHRPAHQVTSTSFVGLNLTGNIHQKLDQFTIEKWQSHFQAMHRTDPRLPFHTMDEVASAAFLICRPGV